MTTLFVLNIRLSCVRSQLQILFIQELWLKTCQR